MKKHWQRFTGFALASFVTATVVSPVHSSEQTADNGIDNALANLNLNLPFTFDSIKPTLLGLLYSTVATIFLIILIKTINRVFPKLCDGIRNWLISWSGAAFLSLRVQTLEILSVDQIINLLIGLVRIARWLLIAGLLYAYTLLVLGFFPETQGIARSILGQLFGAIQTAFNAIVGYLPNLLLAAVIISITYCGIRFIRLIFSELGKGTISFPWFHPEWVNPTQRIVTFLVIALAAVAVFPLLPGFDSPAFQGISLFLGVLVSLGSTAAISNMVAGVILIYTRAFQVGDRVKIGDSEGDVEERTLIVTRIRTLENLLVTIPNAVLLDSNITNFSASVRNLQFPLLLRIPIFFSYDVSPVKVHEVLILAAETIPYVLKEPAPCVLQIGFTRRYTQYELDIYTYQPIELDKLQSMVYQNIQSLSGEVGIERTSYTTRLESEQLIE